MYRGLIFLLEYVDCSLLRCGPVRWFLHEEQTYVGCLNLFQHFRALMSLPIRKWKIPACSSCCLEVALLFQYIFLKARKNLHVCIRTYIYICMYTYIYIYIYIYICVCVFKILRLQIFCVKKCSPHIRKII